MEWEKTHKKVKPQSVYSLTTSIRLQLKLDATEHYKSWMWKGRARRENTAIALTPQAAFVTCNLPASPSLEHVVCTTGFVQKQEPSLISLQT